jgi:hypothetical protein
MPRPSSFLITCGLATALAVGIWLWQREDTPTRTDASAVPASKDVQDGDGKTNRRALKDRTDASRSRGAPASDGLPVAPLPPAQPDELPEAVQNARVEAFRGWHENAQRQLMTCLPSWTEAGEPRAVRVFFRPQDSGSVDDEAPSHLRAETVEPLEPGIEVPAKVRTCLDQLLGTEIELPREAPEAQHGHQEIIHVMWG